MTNAANIEIRPIEPGDLHDILRLCETEGYESYLDRETTWRAFTSPGSVTMVASDEEDVIGFAQMMSDGVIQAHLVMIVVDVRYRRRGLGRLLIKACHDAAGGKWVNLLAEDASVDFYRSFTYREMPGIRIHPPFDEGSSA